MLSIVSIRQSSGQFILVSPIATTISVAIAIFILDIVGVVHFPVGFFGVSVFYIGAAFITASVLLFGKPAFIGLYFGLLLATIVTGRFTLWAPVLTLGNLIGALVPYFYFKIARNDFSLSSFGDKIFYLLLAGIAQSFISATWTLGGFFILGIIPPDALKAAFLGWVIGGFAVQCVIGVSATRFAWLVFERASHQRQ